MAQPFPIPGILVRLAIIGAGQRSRTTYQPLWESLQPWCVPVAACDPVAGNGSAMAQALGVEAMLSVSYPRP